jgi:lysophospholipase
MQVDAMDFNAFDSPNMKPLATVGVNIDIEWAMVQRAHEINRFSAHKQLNPNVSALRLFPSITSHAVRAFLSEPIQGVVLESYGAGNAPTLRTDIMDLLKEACDRGVIIVNCTQCIRGIVSDAYETGKQLASIGVVPGSDMTPEAALTKLSYLLGKYSSVEHIRLLVQKDLRGELTLAPPIERRQSLAVKQPRFIQAIVEVLRVAETGAYGGSPSSDVDTKYIQKSIFPHLVCASIQVDNLSELRGLLETPADIDLCNLTDHDGRT